MFRFLGFLRDFLLRDCDTTYFGPAIWQYVNGGIGNDGKTRKKPSNLATRLTGVKYICIYLYTYVDETLVTLDHQAGGTRGGHALDPAHKGGQ